MNSGCDSIAVGWPPAGAITVSAIYCRDILSSSDSATSPSIRTTGPCRSFRRTRVRIKKTLVEQERQWKNSASGAWDKEELRQLFLRGGGDVSFFESVFADIVEKYHREQAAIADGTFHAAGGAINYLVSARKP